MPRMVKTGMRRPRPAVVVKANAIDSISAPCRREGGN